MNAIYSGCLFTGLGGDVLQQHYYFVASLTTAPQLVLLFQ